LFLLDEIHPAFDYLAVLVFMVGHVLIILRNGQGVWAYLRAKSATRHRTIDLVTALGVVLVTAILFVLTLLERLRGSPLLVILVAYAAVPDLSLWTGWASTRAGYFPRRNALLIASGALCFFVGGLPGWVQPDSRTIPGAGDDPVRDLDLLHTGDCAPFPQAWFCPNPQVRVQFRYRSVRPA